jgi:transcription initiation factor IIF auxiliary subunit
MLRLCIGNTHENRQASGRRPRNTHAWECFVDVSWSSEDMPTIHGVPATSVVDSVHFDLHPTFNPQCVDVTAPRHLPELALVGRYSVRRTGWGEFEIDLVVKLHGGARFSFRHMLAFNGTRTCAVEYVPVTQEDLCRAVAAERLQRITMQRRRRRAGGTDAPPPM